MITEFAVRHRVAVLVLVIAIVTGGLIAYGTLPREASPDVKIPNIIVSVPYPGVSPQDIETLVTNPLERELNDIKDLDEMTSTSAEGAAMVNLKFTPEVDINEALQRVRDKVDKVKPDLPPDAEEPIITEISFSDFPIILVFVSGDYSLVRLKQVAEDIKDAIDGIEGVLSVRISGGVEREIQIDVDPAKLDHLALTLTDVTQAISGANVNIPGGSVDSGNIGYLLRVPAELSNVEELRKVVVKTVAGKPITLDRVAEIRDGFKDIETYSRINRVPGVSIAVTKRAGANLIGIVDQMKSLIDQMKPDFPKGTEVSYLADQSTDIRRMVAELENNILSGLVLVLVVLLLFLGGRNSFFVATSIPLSMLIAFLVLSMMGITLNMVVLFSLILALGMLVDNAIVIVENIYRHATELGKDRVQAALDGTREVAWPVITSTLTTLCAFGPLLFWPGIMGEFMSYLPQTLIITLSASLFVALVVNPVLCAAFLGRGKPAVEGRPSLVIRLYRATLRIALRFRWITALLSILVLIGTMAIYGVLGAGVEFFPNVTPQKIFIAVEAPDGTNIDASNRIVRDIEAVLTPLDNIEKFVADVGGGKGQQSPLGGGSSVPNESRITVDFREHDDWTERPQVTIETIREGLQDKVVGATVEVQKQEMGPPAGAPINIEVAGDDYDHLADVSRRIQDIVATVDGTTDIRDNYSEGRPELRIDVNRVLSSQLGIKSPRELGGAVRTAVNGSVASKLRELDEEYDITVRLAKRFRESIPDIEKLKVYGEKGLRVPLGMLARIYTSTGSGSIRHTDRKRVATVSANVEGRNANEALADVRKKLEGFDAGGAMLSFTGENKEQAKAQAFLSKALLAALALITLVLVTQFNSMIQPGIIMVSVILSLIGVFWGLMITQTPFGIMMTGIGVISLAGVVVNNAIVLIDYMNQLREGGAELEDAIVEAGATRLRPVLLTAVTTILGLIPMATGYGFDFLKFEVQVGGQSAEWWGPMAIAVIFGLAVSTVLTLVVVPTLYYLLERLRARVSAFFSRHRWVQGVAYTAVTLVLIAMVAGIVSSALQAGGATP